MDLRDRPEDEAFRKEVRSWLDAHVVGEFAALGGRGGSGDETFGFETRLEWERVLADGGWTCIGWPVEYGGRGATIAQQVIFNEEYVRARAPGRVSVMGEGLIGPTIIQYGTAEQKARFLPPIVAGQELWCQGYSEPNAGSDLANVQTKAVLDGDEWVVTGQKVWTSLAQRSDWCFVVCRTDPDRCATRGSRTCWCPWANRASTSDRSPSSPGTSEFNEVFFDGARTAADNVVGEVGDGWRVALATLAFERGVALLGHQLSLPSPARPADRRGPGHREGDRPGVASAPGPLLCRARDPPLQHLAQSCPAWTARWHRPRHPSASCTGPAGTDDFGELAMDVLGPAGLVAEGFPYELDEFQRTFLFSRLGDHLRRLQRDPEEHHRRAGPRPAARAQRGHPMTRPCRRPTPGSDRLRPSPSPPSGHGLLDGKVVVVTAAAGTGIGFATAKRCVEEGAAVVISDAHERRLGEAADALAELPSCGTPAAGRALQRDRRGAGAAPLRRRRERHGRFDVAVNNAGLGGQVEVVDMTDEQWSLVLDVTLTGTFRCTRAALRHFYAQGDGGVIVNNASVLGWRAQAGQAHYAAAKAGVMALTRCRAVEAAPHGVRVNAVSPSLAVHPFLNRVMPDEELAELAAVRSSAVAPRCGRWPTSWSSWPVSTPPT